MTSRFSWVLCQRSDEKARNLAQGLSQFGITLESVSRWNSLFPFYLMALTVRYRSRPRAVIYRYLNDHESLAITFTYAISELFGVMVARALRIPILWLCHNVDRETKVYWRTLNNFRRKLLIRFSREVVVTDPLLVPHAVEKLGVCPDKLRFITFGRPTTEINLQRRDYDLERRLTEFLARSRETGGEKAIVGLALGHASRKTRAQFSFIIPMLNEAELRGFSVRMIVAGPIGEYLRKDSPEVLQALEADGRVFFHDKYTSLSDRWISENIDFWWRVYDDFSVPYGIYHAAALGKPILTLDQGFLGQAVREYELGVVLDPDFRNLEQALSVVRSWQPDTGQRFLSTHNWDVAARHLRDIIERIRK